MICCNSKRFVGNYSDSMLRYRERYDLLQPVIKNLINCLFLLRYRERYDLLQQRGFWSPENQGFGGGVFKDSAENGENRRF